MEAFSSVLAMCEDNQPVASEFPLQRPATWSSDVFLSAPEQIVEQTGDLRRYHVHYDVTEKIADVEADCNLVTTDWLLKGSE